MPWRKVVWAFQKGGQHSSLSYGKLFRRFPEIALGSRLRTIKAASEVHPVQVKFHDLVLWDRPLDPHRQKHLEYFPIVGPISQIKHVPGQLLRHRTGTLADTSGLGILDQRPEHPEKIDPAVFVKAVVLFRNDRVHQIRRDLVQRYLFSILNEDFSEDLS